MSPETKDAYQFAAEIAKQILTLSTGVIALVVGMLNSSKDPPRTAVKALIVFAVLFVLSIIFGLLTLNAIAGRIGTFSNEGIYGGIRLVAGLQQITFVLGLIWTVHLGIRILLGRDRVTPREKPSHDSKSLHRDIA